ncbi:DUF423 domain-containing protein [Pontibacter sp. G13]|uniref:DUF423 domain-containing protein n=1 Tax=Pontibacter sp. G13 TaxID=3074898 RepID=UPI0028890D63|nr:DUF423 domain-containing protein [Pontibacter sp. G13]WNJ19948.1 DUF423 domain-containing protein [Pontibacter sp. G13]
MDISKWAFVIGSILGLTGVIAGAMGAHALEKVLEPSKMDSFETAVRFQMYHAILLLVLGFLKAQYGGGALNTAIICVIAGIILFSGSIYLLVLTPVKVGIVTPIGGSILIVGWGALVWWAISQA